MSEPTLDVTVVIPTFNRRDALLRTLDRLARVEYPADRWEIVVVDDGSSDSTEASVRNWMGQTVVALRYFRQGNAGPAKARNLGAGEARGRVLIFLDNDIEVRPDFLRLHLETLAAHPGCWVFGRIIHPPELRQTPFGRYLDALHKSYFAGYPADRVFVVESGLTAQNLSLPAADFRRLGGFDAGFPLASGEDNELGLRARASGLRVLYDPRIQVLHNDWADSLDRYCERQRMYSFSDVYYWRRHGASCPRAPLVLKNAPVRWGIDSGVLVLKKIIKSIVATPQSRRLIQLGCRVAERIAPDTVISHKLYNLAIGAAIFRGVREGWRKYPGHPQASVPPQSTLALSTVESAGNNNNSP